MYYDEKILVFRGRRRLSLQIGKSIARERIRFRSGTITASLISQAPQKRACAYQEGMDIILKEIEDFAGKAHGTQRRKYADEPYIAHPVRVMKICREYTANVPVLAAALLHDVLEDTPVKKGEISKFLEGIIGPAQTAETVRLVEWLTDVYTKQNYPKLNRKKRRAREADRLSEAPAAAQTVKYADIIDNATDITRNDTDFARVFLRECRQLLTKMDQGDPGLYLRAQETVDSCLNELTHGRQKEQRFDRQK